jgi:hypothetical protein
VEHPIELGQQKLSENDFVEEGFHIFAFDLIELPFADHVILFDDVFDLPGNDVIALQNLIHEHLQHLFNLFLVFCDLRLHENHQRHTCIRGVNFFTVYLRKQFVSLLFAYVLPDLLFYMR